MGALSITTRSLVKNVLSQIRERKLTISLSPTTLYSFTAGSFWYYCIHFPFQMKTLQNAFDFGVKDALSHEMESNNEMDLSSLGTTINDRVSRT